MKADIYQIEVNTGYTKYETEEEHTAEAAKYREVGIEISPWNEVGTGYLRMKESKVIAQGSDLLLYLEKGIQFTVLQKLVVDIDPSKVFQEMAEKQEVSYQGPGGDTYNNRVDVHMPGQFLASYNEVMVMEDCCSDGLQCQISGGWRIIACCPQPDQRRPDYILGRYNPNKEVSDDAERAR